MWLFVPDGQQGGTCRRAHYVNCLFGVQDKEVILLNETCADRAAQKEQRAVNNIIIDICGCIKKWVFVHLMSKEQNMESIQVKVAAISKAKSVQ